VAKEAIRQMSYWNKKYGISLKVGINISPKQVDNVNFASDIFGYVEEFGMDPKCVDIELTEASLVNAEEIMQTVLKKFSDKGMSISIDDFGTGFSSMNYIKKYPLDRLKIAKELVDNIAINEIDRDVVKSVITLAKNIELKTIAEGVEDETQLEILREIKAGANITVGVRISASSWLKGDWDVEESVKLACELEKNGADFIHVSAGGVYAKVDSAPKFTPLYQAGYAKAVKNAVKIPVIAVGLITKASECEALLLGGVCDGVALGRELLRNPYFAFNAMKEFGESEKIENAYKRAY